MDDRAAKRSRDDSSEEDDSPAEERSLQHKRRCTEYTAPTHLWYRLPAELMLRIYKDVKASTSCTVEGVVCQPWGFTPAISRASRVYTDARAEFLDNVVYRYRFDMQNWNRTLTGHRPTELAAGFAFLRNQLEKDKVLGIVISISNLWMGYLYSLARLFHPFATATDLMDFTVVSTTALATIQQRLQADPTRPVIPLEQHSGRRTKLYIAFEAPSDRDLSLMQRLIPAMTKTTCAYGIKHTLDQAVDIIAPSPDTRAMGLMCAFGDAVWNSKLPRGAYQLYLGMLWDLDRIGRPEAHTNRFARLPSDMAKHDIFDALVGCQNVGVTGLQDWTRPRA